MWMSDKMKTNGPMWTREFVSKIAHPNVESDILNNFNQKSHITKLNWKLISLVEVIIVVLNFE